MTTTGSKGFQPNGFQTQSTGGFQMQVEIPSPPIYVRDNWDRDEQGNFIPGGGLRQASS